MAELKVSDTSRERNLVEDKFIVPYQKNLQFTGRKVFLQKLRDKLSAETPNEHNHRVALYGMGGIGKTQIALQYVYTYRTSYDRIYWIRAVDRPSIMTGYLNIAKEARIPIAAGSTPAEIAKAVMLWFRQERKWLLVLDNLDDITVVDNLLPETGPEEHTLISTRNPNSAGIPAKGMEVPLLERADAMALLSRLSGVTISPQSKEESQAEEIVKGLGYLPLAIEQAGAYVREVTGNFGEYWKEYQRNHEVLHRWVPQGNRPYRDSVATTWSMSFKIVQNSHAQAAKLLRILAYLNPDGILLDFLRDGAEALAPDLQQMVANLSQMATALLELEKFSLIKWDRVLRALSIHRLVQIVVRDEMSDSEKTSTLSSVIILCRHAFPNLINDESLPLCRLYQNQVTEPLRWVTTIRTTESAGVLMRVGHFILEEGNPKESEKYLEQSIEISTEIEGRDAYSTLTALSLLARVYLGEGRVAEGAELMETLFAKHKQLFGDNSPVTLSANHHLLLALYELGRYSAVASLAPELIEKEKRVLGEDDPNTVSTMSLLVFTYREQGRLAEATELGEVLLKGMKKLGEERIETIVIMNLLVTVYLRQNRISEAANLAKNVADISVRVLGEDHPRALDAVRYLALTDFMQGRSVEAIGVLHEMLTKQMMGSRAGTPAILDIMHDLAWLYWNHGDFENAGKLYEELLALRVRLMGDYHPLTLVDMSNVLDWYEKQGRVKEVADLKERISAIRQKLSERGEEL